MTPYEFIDYAILDPDAIWYECHMSREYISNQLDKMQESGVKAKPFVNNMIKLVMTSSLSCLAMLSIEEIASNVQIKRVTKVIEEKSRSVKYFPELLDIWSWLDTLVEILIDDSDRPRELITKAFQDKLGFGYKRKVHNQIKNMTDEEIYKLRHDTAMTAFREVILDKYCDDSNDELHVFSPKWHSEIVARYGSGRMTDLVTCLVGIPEVEHSYRLDKLNRRKARIETLLDLDCPNVILMNEKRLIYELELWVILTSNDAIDLLQPMDRVDRFMNGVRLISDCYKATYDEIGTESDGTSIVKPNGTDPDYDKIESFLADLKKEVSKNS